MVRSKSANTKKRTIAECQELSWGFECRPAKYSKDESFDASPSSPPGEKEEVLDTNFPHLALADYSFEVLVDSSPQHSIGLLASFPVSNIIKYRTINSEKSSLQFDGDAFIYVKVSTNNVYLYLVNESGEEFCYDLCVEFSIYESFHVDLYTLFRKKMLLAELDTSLKQLCLYFSKNVIVDLEFSFEVPSRFHFLTGQHIQKLLNHFYDVSYVDVCLKSSPINDCHNIEEIFSTSSKYQAIRNEDNDSLDQYQTKDVNLILRKYQRQAVKWMIHRENIPFHQYATSKQDEIFKKISLKKGLSLYYNSYLGLLTDKLPFNLTRNTGGILADEMGLGKTLEILALIILNPRLDCKVEFSPFLVDKQPSSYGQFNDQNCSWCGYLVKNKFTKRQGIPLNCIKCNQSHHQKCVNFNGDFTKYVCPHCTIDYSKPIQSHSTLIVSPEIICHQWVNEIHRVVAQGKLSMYVYKGVDSKQFVYPCELASYDVVIVTYEVFRSEINFLGNKSYNLRKDKIYTPLISPLPAIQWWRVCLDEAQLVERLSAASVDMALTLSTCNRWCVTGTPVQKSIEDIYGLFVFLGLYPILIKFYWHALIWEPFCNGDSNSLNELLSNFLWRSSKSDVSDQISIPLQEQKTLSLNFSPIERHFYKLKFRECKDDLMEVLNVADFKLQWAFEPLCKLRQACCHPQLVKGDFIPLQRSSMTMEDVLTSLIAKTKLQCEETHRLVLNSMHGQAGILVLLSNNSEAVNVYRKVLRLIKDEAPNFRTDPLQHLHALHNLDELLKIMPEADRKSFALYDDHIHRDAAQIRETYLKNMNALVSNANDVVLENLKTYSKIILKFVDIDKWYVDASEYLNEIGFSEKFIIVAIQELSRQPRRQKKYGFKNFSKLRGFQIQLYTLYSALFQLRSKIASALNSLLVIPTEAEMLQYRDCHLGNEKKTSTPAKSQLCSICRLDKDIKEYEQRLFLTLNQSTNSVNVQRLPGELEIMVLCLVKFLCKHTKNRYDGILPAVRELFALLRKDFRDKWGLWRQIADRVASLDELNMCTMRLRIAEKDEEGMLGVVQPGLLNVELHKFVSDEKFCLGELSRHKGQLFYLNNLRKAATNNTNTQYINEDECAVCCKQLGTQWSVLLCGHTFCCECISVIANEYTVGNLDSRRFKCPVCRELNAVRDVSYVSSTNSQEALFNVSGSHSTKISAIVHELKKILANDSLSKSIIFSSWPGVLVLLGRALQENNIEFRHVVSGVSKKFGIAMNEFKTLPNVSVLLMPLRLGSNGLNIIEATNVMMVEPLINPACEAQAISRIHRISQTKPTFVYRFIIENTIEENILKVSNQFTKRHQKISSLKDNDVLTVEELKSIFTD